MSARPELVDCVPYRARLTLAACIARHTATHAGGRNQHAGPQAAPSHPECARCPIGAARANPSAQPSAVTVLAAPHAPSRSETLAAIGAGRMTVAQAAAAHRVTTPAVRKWMRAAQIEAPAAPRPRHSQHDAALALLRQDVPQREVARRTGASPATVCRWAAEARAAT